MKFCIATLTHNDTSRDVFLKRTIDSFINNTEFDGIIDWFIHCNGKNELIDDVVKECIDNYKDVINFTYSFSEKNMGCGVGINYLNSLVRDYEYVLFLEGDWICLPRDISGQEDWLRDCLNYMEQNKNISQVLLRRYISDYDDRQYGLGYWIKEDNIKNIVQLKNKYLELVKKEYVNNPHIRRTKDFYDAGVLPLKEFYDDEGNPAELKGLPMWGQAEIDAESRAFVLNSAYLLLGNMVHCESWNYYEKYENLCSEIKTCRKYQETGCGGCKYGYFFPEELFCKLCDHSKNYTDMERHGHDYVANLG
jgi:hypothetical protein